MTYIKLWVDNLLYQHHKERRSNRFLQSRIHLQNFSNICLYPPYSMTKWTRHQCFTYISQVSASSKSPSDCYTALVLNNSRSTSYNFFSFFKKLNSSLKINTGKNWTETLRRSMNLNVFFSYYYIIVLLYI